MCLFMQLLLCLSPAVTPHSRSTALFTPVFCFQTSEMLQVQQSTSLPCKTYTLPLSKNCCVLLHATDLLKSGLCLTFTGKRERGQGKQGRVVSNPIQLFPGAIRMLTVLRTRQWPETFPAGCGCQTAQTSPKSMSERQRCCTVHLQLSGIYVIQKILCEDLCNTFHKHQRALSYFWYT